MSARRTGILLLMNLLVYGGLFLWRDADQGPGREFLLPPGLEVEGARSLELGPCGERPRVRVVRIGEERWRLGGPEGPLADAARVRHLLRLLAQAPLLPYAGQAPGGGRATRTVRLELPDGREVTLSLGPPTAVGVLARLHGEGTVHLTSRALLPFLELTPGRLREVRPFPFGVLEIRRLELRRARPPLHLEAERRWLTWFLKKPLVWRGAARTLDDLVAALLGLRREGSQGLPRGEPVARITLATDAEAVTLQLWRTGPGRWVGRRTDEAEAFPARSRELEVLFAPWERFWDHRLFRDPATEVLEVSAAWGGRRWRLVKEAGGWLLAEPRAARADGEVVARFLEDLLRLRVDEVLPGTQPEAAGLSPPWGRLVVRFRSGAGRVEVHWSRPEGDEAYLRAPPSPLVFRLRASRLGVIPGDPLFFVDRRVVTGDWKVVGLVELARGGRRWQFRNTGIEEARQWERLEVTRPGSRAAFVSGGAMREFLVSLYALRAERVVAWSPAAGEPPWRKRPAALKILFPDTRPGKKGFAELVLGEPQPGAESPWVPAWFRQGFPKRPYVYRIDPALLQAARRLLPGK